MPYSTSQNELIRFQETLNFGTIACFSNYLSSDQVKLFVLGM